MQGQQGFHTATTEDHRAWLWVASILSLLYSLLCLAARLVGKWEMIWWDDAALGLAYIFAVLHYGILFKAIAQGLGASIFIIDPREIAHAAKYYFVSRIFSLIAQCISKMSILIFTRRIFSGNFYSERFWFQVAYTAVLLFGVCAVMLSSAGCHPQLALLDGRDLICKANMARWGVITALDVLTEVLIVALPIYFVSKNTIKNSKKGIIVFIFSFRLLVAAFSLATLVSYAEFFMGNSRISIGLARTVGWQEILLGFSLMTASIPCLRGFLDAFKSTGLMTVYGRNIVAYRRPDTTQSSQSQSKTQSKTPEHTTSSRLRVPLRPRLGQRHSSGVSRRFRPDDVAYKADVHSHSTSTRPTVAGTLSKLARTPESIESFRSDQLEIHRDFEVRVTHT